MLCHQLKIFSHLFRLWPGLFILFDVYVFLICCVFWPAFGCCAHLKAGQNIMLDDLTNREGTNSLTLMNLFFFCSLSGVFSWVLDVKSLKKVGNKHKRLKMAEKNGLTSFWAHAAPKSWSKYTTPIFLVWFLFPFFPSFSTLFYF